MFMVESYDGGREMNLLPTDSTKITTQRFPTTQANHTSKEEKTKAEESNSDANSIQQG